MSKRASAGLLLLTAICGGLLLGKGASAELVAPDQPEIRIDTGLVRGVTAGGVTSFKAIPYAAPPTGALRWRVPQSAESWPGVRAADRFGPACLQSEDVPKSEDCLTLNVWRPEDAPTAPLPVMVWIAEGMLMHGSASLHPLDAIARQGVVAVSLNYRMGRFGFFAHPALALEAPDDVRGNYGFMDQRAALQWVQRNIAAFGGDPAKVTIAGGGSVLVHLTSPLSRGLFARAILQSPGEPTARRAVLPLASLAEAETIATDYARAVGAEAENPAATLLALRALPASRLLADASPKEEIASLSAGGHVAGFAGAIRDGKLIAEAPEAALAASTEAIVPIIVGANDRDLAIGTAASKDQLFAALGPDADVARRLYDPRGDQTLAELRQQVFADRTLVEPVRHLADAMARAGQPVWLYRFAYVAQAQRGAIMGARHGFEVPFTLDSPAAPVGAKITPTDKAMAATASAYWVQFAKTGDPNGGDRPDWPRHDAAADRILQFTNSGVTVGTDPLKARLDLWRSAWARDRQTETVATGSVHRR